MTTARHRRPTGRLDDRPIRVDARRTLEERGRLLLPHADANVVDDVHQQIDVLDVEPAAEVTRGRRVGNRACTERVEERCVVASDLDVVEHEPAAHRVVDSLCDLQPGSTDLSSNVLVH